MDKQRTPAIGRQGLSLVLIGALLVLASFRLLNWYGISSVQDAASDTTFAALHSSVDQFGGARAAAIYFDWLSYAFLIATIALGVLANLTWRFTDLSRILGFVVGFTGVGATYYALLQYGDAQADAGAVKHDPLYNGSWGLAAVLLGFILLAVGSVLGPRRVP